MPQLRNLCILRVQGCESRRHGLKRCPNLDHFNYLALGFANDVDAAPRHGADEPFLLEEGQCLANRCTTDAQRARQLSLIEPELLLRIVNIGVGDRGLQARIRLVTQTLRVEWCQDQWCRIGGALKNCRDSVHYVSRILSQCITGMMDARNKAMTRQAGNEIGSKRTLMTHCIIQTYIKPLRAATSLPDARHRTASLPLILAPDNQSRAVNRVINCFILILYPRMLQSCNASALTLGLSRAVSIKYLP